MGRSDWAKQDGFTLIEVLVALTILAVGLLALALMQTTAIKANALSSNSTVATQLAQDRLEEFKNSPWTAVVSSATAAFGNNPTTANVTYTALPASAGDNVVLPGKVARYLRVWRVVDASTNAVVTSASGTNAPLKTITVWVCWQDERQNWHNVMLATQRTNN